MTDGEDNRSWSAQASTRILWGLAAQPRQGRTTDQRARALIAVARRAAQQAQQRLYGRSQGNIDECFALLKDVPSALDELLSDSSHHEAEANALDRDLATQMGRALAQTVHLSLHRAWQREQSSTTKAPKLSAVARLLRDCERNYRDQLMASRSACRQGRGHELQLLLEEIVSDAFDGLSRLTTHVAQLPGEERQRGALGLRVARLGRKTAMLCAALVLLRARLSAARTLGTTADIARSRAKLTRNQPRLRATPATLPAKTSLKSEVRLCGYIEKVTWIARPETPYTRLQLAGGKAEIHVHHKNLTRMGLQPRMRVWACGKLEEVDGARVLVAAFEGPGQHSDTYWEDWLAQQVRGAYDLYPEVLFMEWEYPPAGESGISKDLRARLGRRASKEG